MVQRGPCGITICHEEEKEREKERGKRERTKGNQFQKEKEKKRQKRGKKKGKKYAPPGNRTRPVRLEGGHPATRLAAHLMKEKEK